MFDLPKETEIKKNIYKKLVYEKFPAELTGNKKNKFDKEISKITIINEISEQSVKLKATEEVYAIFVVKVDLKTRDFDQANIALIAKIFGQKLLLVLKYEENYKLAIYETKLLMGEWKKEDEISLPIKGLDLTSVWENIVLSVSGYNIGENRNLQEQIEIEEEKQRLKRLIESTSKKARRESQAKKKLELFKQVKALKKELEEM